MSFVEVFDKLHISVKSVVLSMLALMPFWYMAMYLFKPGFIENTPIQIPIIICFCLELAHLAQLAGSVANENIRVYNAKYGGLVIFGGFSGSLASLSMSMTICFFFKFSFLTFTVLSFVFSTMFMFYVSNISKKEDNEVSSENN